MNTLAYSADPAALAHYQDKYKQLEQALVIRQPGQLLPYLASFKDEKFQLFLAAVASLPDLTPTLLAEMYRVLAADAQLVLVLPLSEQGKLDWQSFESLMKASGFHFSQLANEEKQGTCEITLKRLPCPKAQPLKRKCTANTACQPLPKYQQVYGHFIYNPIIEIEPEPLALRGELSAPQQSSEAGQGRKDDNPFAQFVGKEAQQEKINEKELLAPQKQAVLPEQLLSGGCATNNKCANCPFKGKSCAGNKVGCGGCGDSQVAVTCSKGSQCCGGTSCKLVKDLYKNLSKQELDDLLKSQQVQTSCGKCYLGDDQRCESCPFRGLPTYAQGDSTVKLVQGQSDLSNAPQQQEQSAVTKKKDGKVKLDV